MSAFTVDFENTPFAKTDPALAYVGQRVSDIDRLNWRCELLLTRNQEAIKNKRILDMASHDGRFSYACTKLGAKHVTGVEGRPHLVENSIRNFNMQGINSASFDFICDDIFNRLAGFDPGQFDTILCLGFFYHTLRQAELLSEVARIKPQTFVLDTEVAKVPPIFKLIRQFRSLGSRSPDKLWAEQYMIYKYDDSTKEDNTIDPLNLIGLPTDKAVQMLLNTYGFRFQRINWDTAGVQDWAHLSNYKTGKRVSYIAEIK